MQLDKKDGFKKIKKINRIEVVVLIIICIVTVIPLNFGFNIPGIAPRHTVALYYALSCLAMVAFQFSYMKPVKNFRVLNWKGFSIGLGVFVALVAVWISGADGRIISFENLEEGAVFSPLVLSVVLPLIQGATNAITTNSIANMEK